MKPIKRKRLGEQIEVNDILEKMAQADMVLVGLGEEFDETRHLRQDPAYVRGWEWLQNAKAHELLPLWMEYCLADDVRTALKGALDKLAHILEGKNYFVVSLATNPVTAQVPWREGRFVAPCGTTLWKQCGKGCGQMPLPMTESDRQALTAFFQKLYQGEGPGASDFQMDISVTEAGLGSCPGCGAGLVPNTIYAEHYDEKGYLDQWQQYTKWLQGTLNRKLLILELGVGMKFPLVIRWPFEKIAFYNQKASFWRINEHLYQLTEELAGKGQGISQNAIDWLVRV